MVGERPPQTYLEWVQCLEALYRNEDFENVLKSMELGRLEWTSGVAERFTNRLCELLDKKLHDAVNHLQKDLNCSGNNETAIVQALLAMRREYTQIYKLASLPVLSDKTKFSIQEMVSKSVQTMQQSLEESAQRDRTGQMMRIVRNIPIIYNAKTDSTFVGSTNEGLIQR